ncbi:MAG: hypothetical protein GY929_26450 [Actinomycetia bacterium]|nr:hypothetical protein [Actinomycetes bacterium]
MPSNYERDAGSRTMLDVLLFRRGDVALDRQAVADGDGRKVTCILRSGSDAFPDRFKQGVLHLNRKTARWSAGLGAKGSLIPLPLPVTLRGVRQVERGDRRFEVVELDSPDGSFELKVPAKSVELIRFWLELQDQAD